MVGFDDNGSTIGDCVSRGLSSRIQFTAISDSSRSSRPLLEREPSFNDIQIKQTVEGSQGNLNPECLPKKDSLQMGFQFSDEKPTSRGGLGERIAARAGFHAPRVNTEKIRPADFSFNPDVRSPCLKIYSPGLSPATLLESPVFLSNTLVQPSPTTGKLLFESSFKGNIQSKSKEDFFEDINGSFAFPPVSKSSPFLPAATSQVASLPHKSFPDIEVSVESDHSSNSQTVESVKPISQNKESFHLGAGFPALSSEKDNRSNPDLADQKVSNTADESSELCPPLDDPQDEELRRQTGYLKTGVAPAEDGYNWRKYGQKPVKGSEYPRSYYKCTHLDCQAKRKIERRSSEGHISEIIYEGTHNHPKPLTNRQSANSSLNTTVDFHPDISEQMDSRNATSGNLVWVSTQQGCAAGTSGSVEETSVGPADIKYENPSGALQVQNGTRFQSGEMVDASSGHSNGGDENEEDSRTHGSVSLGYNESDTKRRRLEVFATEMTGATRAIREPRVVVQTTSDVDIIDDGYRWRKYGQKVVKGNPNPRSYYKCTALGCTVRKHVERACNDLDSVITTYEGKHNHDVPAARNSSHAGSGTAQQASVITSMAQSQHETRHKFERPASSPSLYGPFSFHQPWQHPGTFGMNQQGLGNMANPGLRFAPWKLPVLPLHPYLVQQQPSSGVGDGLPKGNPQVKLNSEPEFDLSNSSSIYQQMINRLPLGPHM